MKGFIVDRTYRIKEGKAYVYLFGRLENGDSFQTKNVFAPYFYIKTADLERAKRITNFTDEATALTTMQGEPVTKIILTIPKDVPVLKRAFEDEGIPCYEADIRFTQRFLMHHDIFATVEITGKHEQGEHVARIYEEPTLKPTRFHFTPRTLSFDIETSFDGKDLYSISLVTHDFKEALLVSSKKEKIAHTLKFPDEKSLLEHFVKRVKEIDPDIVTGWNVIDFDLQFLKKKFDQHKVPFALGRSSWTSALRIESTYLRDSKAEIAGRMVLDGIQLLRSSFIALDDYKLETAAQAFLGEGKLLKGAGRHDEIKRLYQENQKKLIEYNIKDSELVLRILDAKNLIELTVLRSMLTGLTMERVRASIASFDSVYIRELHKEGKVAPSLQFNETNERITGGYVKESQPGIYEYILVLDFKSMYPSVIRSFNIDPAAFLPTAQEKETTKEVIVAPNGAAFTRKEGILPTIIQHLWEERDKAKKKDDQVASLAIKTLMNSFFGVLASPNCRFYSLEIGNAITSFARTFIKLAAERIEEQGHSVIYGDTDSVFVKSGAKSKAEAERIGKEIEKKINKFYGEYVTKEYQRKNFMELEAEKIYKKFMMPRLRGTDRGAKKRYAGLLLKDGGERLDFTGLEFVRRDWTELAKKFQLELLDKIFHEKEVTTYVKEFVEQLRAGEHDELLIYKKSIRKELQSYTKTTPPHVKAARILEQKEGKLPSTIITYLMTKNGPEPVGYATGEIDYEHYIEKQIKPLADSVLGFYGTTFDDLLAGSSQQTLFGY